MRCSALRTGGRCAVVPTRLLALQRQRSLCTAHALPTQECPRTAHALYMRTCVGCLILSAIRRNMHLHVERRRIGDFDRASRPHCSLPLSPEAAQLATPTSQRSQEPGPSPPGHQGSELRRCLGRHFRHGEATRGHWGRDQRSRLQFRDARCAGLARARGLLRLVPGWQSAPHAAYGLCCGLCCGPAQTVGALCATWSSPRKR